MQHLKSVQVVCTIRKKNLCPKLIGGTPHIIRRQRDNIVKCVQSKGDQRWVGLSLVDGKQVIEGMSLIR